MPSFSSVSSRSICPRATALPISALRKLLRQECNSVRAEMSPYSTTTTPCWISMNELAPISLA